MYGNEVDSLPADGVVVIANDAVVCVEDGGSLQVSLLKLLLLLLVVTTPLDGEDEAV